MDVSWAELYVFSSALALRQRRLRTQLTFAEQISKGTLLLSLPFLFFVLSFARQIF